MTLSTLSTKQRLLLTWAHKQSTRKKYDAIICDGAVRSGKTAVMVVSFIHWAMRFFNGATFGICGKTVQSAERNIIIPIQESADLTAYYALNYTRSNKKLTVTCGKIENYFYVFGGKDESSYMLIQGITLSGVMFDEVALMPRSFVEQAVARTLSIGNAKLWFNCNPDQPKHWFYLEWVQKAVEKRALHLHFLMSDNPIMTPDKIERAEKMYTGVFRDRYILGLWKRAEGLIYQQFADNTDDYLIDDIDPHEIIYAQIGVDFGGTKSSHSFTLTGFTRQYKTVVVLDEYYHDNRKRRLSPTEVDAAFVDFVRRAKARYKVYEAFCDSAEQTLIEGFEVAAARNKLGIDIKNARKGPINDRIAFYNSLMAQRRLLIMRHCRATIEALQDAVYDDKKGTKDIRLDDGKINIDSLDSLEYSTESVQDDILYL